MVLLNKLISYKEKSIMFIINMIKGNILSTKDDNDDNNNNKSLALQALTKPPAAAGSLSRLHQTVLG
jgi:hypothetical protein